MLTDDDIDDHYYWHYSNIVPSVAMTAWKYDIYPMTDSVTHDGVLTWYLLWYWNDIHDSSIGRYYYCYYTNHCYYWPIILPIDNIDIIVTIPY